MINCWLAYRFHEVMSFPLNNESFFSHSELLEFCLQLLLRGNFTVGMCNNILATYYTMDAFLVSVETVE